MTAEQLIQVLQACGAELAPAGDKLRIKAPWGAIGTDLREAVLELKPEILAILNRPRTETAADACHAGNLQGKPSADEENAARIPLEDLHEYLLRNHYRIVGGDPDLYGWPWNPRLYAVKDA
jgi:hypothetical protein